MRLRRVRAAEVAWDPRDESSRPRSPTTASRCQRSSSRTMQPFRILSQSFSRAVAPSPMPLQAARAATLHEAAIHLATPLRSIPSDARPRCAGACARAIIGAWPVAMATPRCIVVYCDAANLPPTNR